MSPKERVGESKTSLPIHHLVDQTIHGRPDRARKAKRELIKTAEADPLYNTVLGVVHDAQEILLSSKTPGELRSGTIFLDEFLRGVGINVGVKTVALTPEIIVLIEEIHSNDAKLRENKIIGQRLPESYRKVVGFFDNLRPWIDWNKGLEGILNSQEDLNLNDKLVDHLKKESPSPKVDTFFTKKYGDISIKDMEAFEYPLSDEDFERIRTFVLLLLKDESYSTSYNDVISELFFRPTMFNYERGPIARKNRNLLSILNAWQERFINDLLIAKNEEAENKAFEVLKALPEVTAAQLFNIIAMWIEYVPFWDPEYSGNIKEERKRHPLFDRSITYYERENWDGKSPYLFGYSDEMGRDYFLKVVFPYLKGKLEKEGLLERFQRPLDFVRDRLEKKSFSEVILETVQEIFEQNCGPTFFGMLNKHSTEMSEISERVWNSLQEQDVHFQPMQHGINTVEFSSGSVPDIMGLQTISFNTSYSSAGWVVNIMFGFKDIPNLSLLGKIKDDGKVEFRAPLESKMPGLYFMLQHIVILTFHDLVIQRRKEVEETRQEKPASPEGPKGQERPKKKSRHEDLPRTQTDRELIADVYKRTGYTPRRVELHKRLLNGAREYRVAVELFRQAQEDPNAFDETKAWCKGEVERCRTNLHRTSEQKKKDLPALFRLETMVDPLTSEEKYLETWVIEHTSPKPTDEELRSPVRLFERYYKHSSALASLEQLKPWFVGQ